MTIKDLLPIYLFCSLVPLAVMWLLPKQFIIDQSVGYFFIRLLKDSTWGIGRIVEEVSKFKQEYTESYYKDLAKASMFYIVIESLFFVVLGICL